MSEEQEAKKKTLPSPPKQEGKVMTLEEGAQSVFEKFKKQPEKLDSLIDKFSELDPQQILNMLDKSTVTKEDFDLMGRAVIQLQEQIETLDKKTEAINDTVFDLIERVVELEQ